MNPIDIEIFITQLGILKLINDISAKKNE